MVLAHQCGFTTVAIAAAAFYLKPASEYTADNDVVVEQRLETMKGKYCQSGPAISDCL